MSRHGIFEAWAVQVELYFGQGRPGLLYNCTIVRAFSIRLVSYREIRIVVRLIEVARSGHE